MENKYHLRKYLTAILLLICLSEPLRINLGPFQNTRSLIPFILIIIVIANIGTIRLKIKEKIVDYQLLLIALLLFVTALSSLVNIPLLDLNTLILFVTGLVSFFVAYYSFPIETNKQNTVVKIVISLISIIACLFSLISVIGLIFPASSLTLSNTLAVGKTTKYILYDYYRGRIYPLFNHDLSIPISAIFFGTNQVFILIILQTIALFASNYRGRIIVGILAVLLILYIYQRKTLRTFSILIATSLILSILLQTTNFLSRASLRKSEDVDNIRSRLYYSINAFKTGFSKPLLGVGVSNYLSYSPSVTLYSKGVTSSIRIPSTEHPHNTYALIFAELGIPGTLLYLLFIGTFIKRDIKLLHKSSPFILGLTVSSWTFIVGSSLDWYSQNLFVYFMFIRGMLLARQKSISYD